MSPAQIAAGIDRLTTELAGLRTADLTTLLRTSPTAARELRALFASPDVVRVALWDPLPLPTATSAALCVSLGGSWLGGVTYSATARVDGDGWRIPEGWSYWVCVTGRGRPRHMPCRDRDSGLQLVTTALVADGWTVRPLPAPSSTPQGTSGADTAAEEGVSSEVSDG